MASYAIASPWALPSYIAVRVAMQTLCSINLVTLVISDFANIVLLLLAVEQARQSNKIEHGVEALVAVEPKLPDAIDG